MEQENITQSENRTKENKPKKSKLIWYILLVLVVAAIGAYLFQQNKEKMENLKLSPSEIEALPKDQKKKVLEQQLRDLQAQEKQLSSESDRSDRFTVYIQLAEVRTELGLHNEALEALDTIQSENNGNTRLWMTYAQVYMNMGRMDEARVRIREALKIDPELSANWLVMFEAARDLSKEEQESLYKEALIATSNHQDITAAYQTWQSQQAK